MESDNGMTLLDDRTALEYEAVKNYLETNPEDRNPILASKP
jgi:hypothetical protein